MISPLLQSTLNIAHDKDQNCLPVFAGIYPNGTSKLFWTLECTFLPSCFLGNQWVSNCARWGSRSGCSYLESAQHGPMSSILWWTGGTPTARLGLKYVEVEHSWNFLDVGADVLRDSLWLLCLEMPAGFADCQTCPLLRHLPPAFAALPWQEDASTWDWCGKRRFFANVEGSIVGLLCFAATASLLCS